METSTLGRRLERGTGTKLLKKKKRKKEAKERRRKKNKKERKEEGKGTTCQGETWRNLHSILGIIDQFDSHFYSNVTEKNVALFGINRNSVLLEEATFPFCFYPHSGLSSSPTFPVHILTSALQRAVLLQKLVLQRETTPNEFSRRRRSRREGNRKGRETIARGERQKGWRKNVAGDGNIDQRNGTKTEGEGYTISCVIESITWPHSGTTNVRIIEIHDTCVYYIYTLQNNDSNRENQ